jgi:hypothetical protein
LPPALTDFTVAVIRGDVGALTVSPHFGVSAVVSLRTSSSVT